MNKLALSSLFVLSCALVVNGASSKGRCPYLSPVHIGQHLFGGKWFEVRRAESMGESYEKCNTIEYTFTRDDIGWFIEMNSTSFNGHDYQTKSINVRQPPELRKSSLGVFVIEYQHRPTSQKVQNNLFVLHVDSNLALIYFCYEIGPIRMDLAWVMSRERVPEMSKVRIVEQKLIRNGIDLRLVDVDQVNCPDPENIRDRMERFEDRDMSDDQGGWSRDEERIFAECSQQMPEAEFAAVTACFNAKMRGRGRRH